MARRDTKEKLKNQTPLLFENILEEGVGNFNSDDEVSESSPEETSEDSATLDIKDSESESSQVVENDDSKDLEKKNELPKSNTSTKKQKDTPKSVNPILNPVNPIIKKDRIQRIFQVDGYISEKIDEMTRDKKNKLLPGAKGAISQMVNNGLVRELVSLGVFPESYLEEKIKDYY